ncbi:S49 family peptidase [Bermanella marisrubri]|uniref:Periplasmic serine protease (ClpP class) n=1 Tax=Bermanella marisrubri TaxID=207949 RepID=Q1N4V4_9GAMM|nr:S49 family peptidase [Bermanella marisrubri]EAT13324.1 Periplasmic serine protease (ClpP class) [Oceanobacter sp. RED65] [Bermanella marisrubri]QIZ84084.1 S49 family peptidase [Bermanella marisrubri]
MYQDPVERPDSDKEWKLIEKMVMNVNAEQRRSRRWGIFFKLLTFVYLFAAILIFMPSDVDSSKLAASGKFTALVEVRGVIADGEEASADIIVTGLRNAFEAEGAQAVILRINSPGGSPVQSGYVYDEIMRLKELHQKPVYAVISDLGASGAYYMAAAADEIYADKASLVGSIGVVGSGFGFVDAMDKLGVERRLFTAGEHKAFLDPFSPLDKKEEQFWEQVLSTTHDQFIEQVKKGRGDRLVDNDKLFSGLVWTGEQALGLGLVDGLGSSSYVARELVGAEDIVDFTPQPTPFEALVGRFGTQIGKGIASMMGLNGMGFQLQ